MYAMATTCAPCQQVCRCSAWVRTASSLSHALTTLTSETRACGGWGWYLCKDPKRDSRGQALSDQLKHYTAKLAYEIDSWDLKVALESGEAITIVDARSSTRALWSSSIVMGSAVTGPPKAP